MESYDPLSQLASCCFGRRSRNASGFKTAALRNQYLYSPSMAHMNAGAWPMTSSGIPPTTIFTGGLQPSQAQPYILLTQPVIVNSSGQLESLQQHPQAATMALFQQQPGGQHIQTIQYIAEQSPLRKVPSMLPGQFAIYSTGEAALRNAYASNHQPPPTSVIYETPARHLGPTNNMVRNMSAYLSPQQQQIQRGLANRQQQQHQQQQQQQQHTQQRQRRLDAEIFKRLEVVEKQVDLSADMDLVERHGIVITRPIEPMTLAPHLTDDMLKRYQTHLLLDDQHVIKFIEIVKRPGQTLGLYIRAIQMDNGRACSVREGIVITKIELDSPVYTSNVIHIGDEILSINLIDIQDVSLDDVVTLMSIPKRLVLVLRIPKERESQLVGCELVKRQQFQQRPLARNMRAAQDGRQLVQRGTHSMVATEQYSPPTEQKPIHQSASKRANCVMDLAERRTSDSNEEDFDGQQQFAQMARAGPTRVQAAIQETLGEQMLSDEANFDIPKKLSNNMIAQSAFLASAQHAASVAESHFTTTLMSENDGLRIGPRMQNRFERPHSPLMDQLDGQVATQSQSIDESRCDGAERFRNYSMDPDIAKLEREAMNKEKHPSFQVPHLDDMDAQQQHQRSLYNYGMSAMSDKAEHQQQQAPSTLPRRTLPTRPDLMSPPPVGALSPTDASLKPTIISNIRLGDTPEQSNYFTSSIDAINRELKELRRQRLAMASCEDDGDPNQNADSAPNSDL